MSYDDTRVAITSHFATNWAASAYSAVPVWYPNQSFNQTNQDYVALTIVGTGGDAISIGSPDAVLDRYSGYVQTDIVVSENTGESTALKMADVAAAIFRRAELSHGSSGSITFRVENEPVRQAVSGKYRIILRHTYERDIIQ